MSKPVTIGETELENQLGGPRARPQQPRSKLPARLGKMIADHRVSEFKKEWLRLIREARTLR